MRFAIAYAHANKALSASCPARQGCICITACLTLSGDATVTITSCKFAGALEINAVTGQITPTSTTAFSPFTVKFSK